MNQQKIIEALSAISNMCIGLNHTLDADHMGQMIYDATGMTNLELNEYIRNQRSERVWFPVRRLPTPQIPLKLKLDTGEIIDGVRPSYIASYGESDLGYRDSADNILFNVVSWAIA